MSNTQPSGTYESWDEEGYLKKELQELEKRRRVATDHRWLLARHLRWLEGEIVHTDSRTTLENLGFTVGEIEGPFYIVVPPAGWLKKTIGFFTFVGDEEDHIRMRQLYIGDDTTSLEIYKKGSRLRGGNSFSRTRS